MVQTMIQQNGNKFETGVEEFTLEDVSIFMEATKCHQWLRNYLNNYFSPKKIEPRSTTPYQQRPPSIQRHYEEEEEIETYLLETMLLVPSLNPHHSKHTNSS